MSKGILEIGKHDIGDRVEGYVLVKSVTKGLTTNGSEYLTVIFKDKTGEIEAKIWDNIEEAKYYFYENNIVYLAGHIGEFKGKPQLRIMNCNAEEDENISVEDFVPSAPILGDDVLNAIQKIVNDMKNTVIKNITSTIIEKYQTDFKIYPAAKGMHHAYVGGLAYHTYGMLNLAKVISDLYPMLNKDLLYAGVILHDVCKVKEYTDAINPDYSVEGKLVGHISMVSEEIALVAKELGFAGEEEVTLLQHMVLSHHGKLEWGSPVQPQIMEAEMLHFIDNMDAKMEMYREALEKVNPGHFTERIRGLDNRTIYKPSI